MPQHAPSKFPNSTPSKLQTQELFVLLSQLHHLMVKIRIRELDVVLIKLHQIALCRTLPARTVTTNHSLVVPYSLQSYEHSTTILTYTTEGQTGRCNNVCCSVCTASHGTDQPQVSSPSPFGTKHFQRWQNQNSQAKVKQTQTKYHKYRISTQTEELLYSWPMQANYLSINFYEK